MLSGLARAEWRKLTEPPARVVITRCAEYSQAVEGMREVWDQLGQPSVAGRRVVVKPNMVHYLPGYPAITSPALVGALIGFLREAGAAEVVVADGGSFTRDSYRLVTASGLGKTLDRHGVRFVDLNYDDLEEVPLAGNYGSRLSSLWLPRTIMEADFLISMPKLKTHHWEGVSLSLKNLFGVVPGSKYGWPKNTLHVNGIPQSILALYETLRPDLAIVDGVVGMEGDGPVYGSAVNTGVIIAGCDCVAVDATAARVMGVDPASVGHLKSAGALGLGFIEEERIRVVGTPVREVARTFARPPAVQDGT